MSSNNITLSVNMLSDSIMLSADNLLLAETCYLISFCITVYIYCALGPTRAEI
jgi:hypothetical protein